MLDYGLFSCFPNLIPCHSFTCPCINVIGAKLLQGKLLSYDFYHNIIVSLFHDKKCGNCINLFTCIFVKFYCIGFSIKLVKTQA